MKFLIAGDSWGCGEWELVDKNCVLSHPGLEQYLKDEGLDVINLSKGGSSNFDTVTRLSSWFDRFSDDPISGIFVFQTEYTRDYKHYRMQADHGADAWNIKKFSDLSDKWIGRFYVRLSEIAQNYQCKIYLIGGISDTLWVNNMDSVYPGCHILCQSLTNLLLYNEHRIASPVLSWYSKNDENLLNRVKPLIKDTKQMLKAITMGFERESLLRENPDLFYPDGIHPNRQGHKMLFDFIKNQNLLS